jgi:hypothetical protein
LFFGFLVFNSSFSFWFGSTLFCLLLTSGRIRALNFLWLRGSFFINLFLSLFLRLIKRFPIRGLRSWFWRVLLSCIRCRIGVVSSRRISFFRRSCLILFCALIITNCCVCFRIYWCLNTKLSSLRAEEFVDDYVSFIFIISIRWKFYYDFLCFIFSRSSNF